MNLVETAAALCLALACGLPAGRAQPPLASLDYHIGGTFMQVTPSTVSVPKGIAGSVLVSVFSGGSTNNATVAQLVSGAYVQAVIRGPGFPAPQVLVSKPNAPLLLPPINLSGSYELDSIALVDAVTGQVRLQGTPSSVPVNVFDQLLISSVTSTPMTLDQIQAAGISIDESSFSAVQFNVSFVLNGQTIPISFPVVSPVFTQATELIPADEVQAKLLQAAAINQQISSTLVQLPAQLQQGANLNIQLQGLNFQEADPGDPASLGISIPSIPALMIIPGNIGFLHQFFSVQVFTENGAPTGSGLSVGEIMAQLQLPAGPDGIVSTNYSQPGDDPLRFAMVANRVTPSIQPVVDPGPGGQLGSSNNITRLQPGETGQAVFYVEGLQEGLWVMNLNLTANLYGLAAGTVRVTAQAAGSVLVRNPSFSITFTHPDVVRVSEPYTASINVLNTGVNPANLVQVTLNQNSISGAMLAPGQPQTIQLGTILPGQSATATYHMIAETTGQITFSDITTSDNSVVGRFAFTMGVDAQGVPLSPDTIAMPDYVNYLPSNLVVAATRVLGQALSIATAAQLPPGIVSMGNAIITTRVLDLADAGQRVQYGDPLKRVLADLLMNWQGQVVPDIGFDSLLRTSDAGAEWTSVLYSDMEIADGLTGTGRLLDRAADLAGLGQRFVVASAGPCRLLVAFTGTTNSATISGSSQPYSLVYPGTNGEWAVTPYLTNAVFTWTFTNGPPLADMAVLLVETNGQAEQLRWQVPNPPVTAVYTFALSDPTQRLQADTNGDGVVDFALAPLQTTVNELPPALVAVQQDLSVVAGRPSPSCINPPPYGNYGTVVAVVFSKLMTQASAGDTNSYTLDGDNSANSVQIQPSGRVALMNLRKGISAIIPRTLAISGVTDVRGNPLVAAPTLVQSFYPGTTNPFTGGVAVKGRVLNGDGSPALGVPVTLTMYDEVHGGDSGCVPWTRRVSQVLTDSGGNFNLDYVMSGIPYSLSASDTTALPPGALQLVEEATVSGQPDSQQLMQLITASSNPSYLLGLLSAGSLAQAVAVVQGLDRAIINDSVALGSSREGQTVPFALRFRGRATVTGQVVGADGVTPVPNAAVNLYPDPSTLELGRGMYSSGAGQFSFPGVPLGVFSVQVATSDHRSATVLGYVNMPGETTNLVIALPTNIVLYATVGGQVFDSDNITPVPNARVYLGRLGVGNTIRTVANMVLADQTGSWQVTNVPIQVIDVAAVTFDGTRMGVHPGVSPVANTITYANVTLQAATTVSGQVTFDNGDPAPNALVAGGVALVTTDANGNFQLQGVPVGNATISAGLAANPAAGIPFTRLGSASANIVAGEANYVVVKLSAAGQIFGQVFDAQGKVQPNVEVAIPQQGGFYWTTADANGNYSFANLALGNYTLSAPGNAVSPQLNSSELSSNLSSGNEDQIMAAFNQAVTVFVGAGDPLVNGDQLNFRPSSWGYTTASLLYDGDNVNANITYIVQGSVSGTVLNGQGVPIAAAVRLTGIGPDVTGAPVTTIRGDTTSDPATGAFGFTNVLLAGPFGLQAASPFYPTVVQTNWFTTTIAPDATGLVLQFPVIGNVNGSIAGHVYYPDGSLVGPGAEVSINVAPNYKILTDTNGFFNTQTEFPAVSESYTLQVFDPSSGLVGTATVAMTPGITNVVDVHLLSRSSGVQVTVLQAGGQPAAGAQVELDQGSYPYQAPIYTTTDTNGVASFTGLWVGTYSAVAQFTEESTRLFARGGAAPGPNQTASITLRLGATGSLVGTFVEQNGVTPVYGAEVTIGNLGFATTDTNGFFEFDGVPIGTYFISSSDPVTGGNATASATLSFNGQTQTVQLVEATLGNVSGLVLDSYNSGFVAGATVSISFSDGVTPARTATTGPNGGFNFPASPMGIFYLDATYTLPNAVNTMVTGQANGSLSTYSTNVSISIQLEPLTSLSVHVVRNDGVTPALNAIVTVSGEQPQNTSTNGDALFSNLQVLGTYTVTAISQEGGDLYDGAQTNVTLSRGINAVVTLMLPGVGYVSGTVVASDGSTPVDNAQVTLEFQNALFGGDSLTALTDAQGRFAFDDVALGPFLVTAYSLSLGAAENGTLATAGQTNQVALRLGPSGSLLGVVVRADDTTPVPGVVVAISYTSQSLNPGRAAYTTDPDGAFHFSNVPVGAIQVQAADPAFNGIINFTTALTNNGQALNLGLIPFDETFPQVVDVTPTNAAIGVPITNSVVLQFSKPLDPASIDPTGIFIHGTNGNVDSTVTLLPDTNGLLTMVKIQPKSPLQSLQVYAVYVLSGELPGATGSIIGSGPRDLVGRAMAATFESEFATADNTPPQLLSIFPSNNAVQINPAAVPRLVFNKTLNPTSFVFQVTGPAGSVPGTAGLGINGQVMTFLPTANLLANAHYSMVISNVFDLAGNRAVGDPFTSTFATIDTIGPVIASLLLASNAVPTGGATVSVAATLATNEIGASVRFTQDFNPIGSATNVPYQVPVQLPRSGSTTIRAIATDQYGNDGQVVQLVITVVPPAPPTVQFTLVSPTNPPVPSGSTLVVAVTASSDTAISNLTAIIAGPASGAVVSTNGASLLVQGVVSNTAVAGQQVKVLAQATDILGLSGSEQTFDVLVSDGTPPTLSILSPASNAVVSVAQPLSLQVSVSDNSSNVTLGLTLSGAITATQSVALALTPNTPLTNLFTVSLAGAPSEGQTFTALVVATDASSNQAAVTRTFRLPDLAAPLVQSIAPANGAVEVDILPTIAVTFNEPMNPSAINASTFQVTHRGVPVPGTYALGQGNLVALWRPAGPLSLGGTYELALTAGITEAGGNPIAPQTTTFTVTDFGILQPTNGATIAEGQLVPAAAGGPNPAGISAVQFSVGGPSVLGPFPAFSASLAAPSLAQLGTNQLAINAVARGGGADVARAKPATASSSYTPQNGPSRAVDGETNQDYNATNSNMFHSQDELHAFWEVDLGYVTPISEIDLYLRTDCCEDRNRFAVLVAAQPFVASDFLGASLPASYSNGAVEVYQTTNAFDSGVVSIPTLAEGRFVRVVLLGQNYLMLAAVQVFAPLQDASLNPVSVNVLSSAQASAALPIQFPASLDLVQGAQSNLTVSASATSGNLVSLRVDELTPSGGTPIAKAEFWNLQFTPARLSEVPFTNPPAYSTSFDTLSYSNSQAPFWPGAQAIQTAARFTGTLFVQTDGAYTFYANSQDGSSISIDGQPVANNDGIHNPSETSGSVVLTNGPHAFQALYFQGLDDAILQVSWSGPGLAKRLIEKSDFSQFSPLQFAETGGPVVSSASGVSNITATLQVRDSFTNAAQIMLTAQDAGGFTAAKLVGVVILPISGLAPIITGPPTNQIVQCTSNATFSVAAVGAAPLSYQWYWFGTNQVPGGTNATLTLSDVSLDSSGSYSVVVTNSFGSALSPAANLNVVDTLPPVITLNGANPMQVVQNTSFADPGATAYDACAGSVPVVVFNGVDPSVVGGYTVLYEATDPSGNSATNARTVLVVPPAVACYPTPGGIAAWWKAESNTVDVVGADNGTLVNGAGYAPGIVGTAFSFTSAGQAVQIPFTPAIDLSALYDWTIETWVNPAGFKNAGYPTIYSQGYWVASLGLNNASGALESWINNANQLVGAIPVPVGQWSHVALVYDGTNRTFYVNGAFAGSGGAPIVNQDSSDSAIGSVWPASGGSSFNGEIDEVSVYGRALTTVEIAGIYAAGSLGKCPVTGTNLDVPPFVTVQPFDQLALQGGDAQFTVTAVGSAPLTYRWRESGTNLFDGAGVSGSATPTLTLSNVSVGGDYSLAVSNLAGSSLSAFATLVIVSPPFEGATNTYWDERTANNNWSQTGVLGNWIDYDSPQGTAYYPNGTNYDVILDGTGGASANLDLSVTLNTLTILNNCGLSIQSGSTLTVSNLDFHGDGAITVGGCCSPETMTLTGGTLAKSAGRNTSAINPVIVLTSLGATLAVDSGTLALPGNNSYYTNGAFDVASNATLALVPANNNANFAGTFTGSGDGSVLLNAGTLSAASGGLTLDLPAPLFQWAGGALMGANPLTNAGVLTIAGANGAFLSDQLVNSGLLLHSGSGNLFLDQGPGSQFENLPQATYTLASDAGIASFNCCSAVRFDNFGLFQKTAGTGDSVVSVTFNDLGGTLDVQTGTLTLANSGASSNATLAVAAGATLDVTGGKTPTWSGAINGTGAGTVLLADGTLIASPSATLNFVSGLFQWAGGTLQGAVTNLNVVTISSTNPSYLGGLFENLDLVRHVGAGNLYLNEGLGSYFDNPAGSTYQFESDAGIYPYNCCSAVTFTNSGLVRKIAGANNSSISVAFNNLGGSIEVDTGTLALANSGSSLNGAFTVAAGAALDLTGGKSPTWAGQMTGAGGGSVQFNSGQINASPSLTLEFPPGMFQWSGGAFNGAVLNGNALTISGTNEVLLTGTMTNSGLVRHLGTGNLGLNAGTGSRFENLAPATYRLESSAAIYGFNCCSLATFDNFGAFIKTNDPGNAVISATFNNFGGLVDIESGTLSLANSGASSNATLMVAGGSALDLTGGKSPTWAGLMTGTGNGAVEFNSGTIIASPGLTLDFPEGMFQWSGGTFQGAVVNSNSLAISGTNDVLLTGTITNSGLVRHSGTGNLGLNAGTGSRFENLAPATYRLESSAAIYGFNCCSLVNFDNFGAFIKTNDPGNAVVSVRFNNLGGLVDVESGTLSLANSGSSVDGSFTVAAGASVDLTGGAQPTWSGLLIGSGAGTIQLNNGQLFAGGLTLDCAPGVFQWTGGILNGPLTNVNEVSISGGLLSGAFFNAGIVRHLGSAGLALSAGGPGSLIRNLPGATYVFQGDGSISVSNCCTTGFENQGRLRKSGGTNTSTISVAFTNQGGSIEVDSGVLAVNGNYAQGAGAFTVQLAGTNSGQFGQLSAANVSLSGLLNVELAAGFTPPLGSRFQVLSCAALSGTFNGGAMPGGIAVNYSNNGVFLVVTGAVTLSAPFIVSQPASVESAAGAGAVFTASAGGAAPMGYQWQFNGVNLADNNRVSGSATPQLILVNLDAADVGNYRLVASNYLGSAASSNATLTLAPCVAPPAGLVGLWTGDGSAFDWVGSHDGTLQSGATYGPGRAGQAFSLDGVSSYVDLGAWSAGSNWTWTAWVNPSSIPAGQHTIVGGVNSCLDWALTMSGGVFGVLCPPTNGCNQAITGGPSAVPGAWYFVAATCDGETARIYVNGQLGNSGPVQTNYAGTASGTRIGGEVCCAGDNFPGLIEEVVLFNHALSAPEVQALYASGNLRLCVAPQILTQPASQTVAAGGTVSFDVVARGMGDVSYQWQISGNNLLDNVQVAGSQSNFLAITSAQFTNAGNYSVVVTGPGGSISSSNATLTVIPTNCVPAPAGIIAWWPGNGTFQDVVSGFDGTPAGQVTFEQAEVGQGFHLVNSSISATGTFDFSASNAMSIELWFELNVDTSYNGLVSALGCCTYRFMVDPSGHLLYNPGTFDNISVGPVLNLGQFYHAAMVVIGGGEALIYLDGQLISSSTNGVPPVLPSVSTFLLGAGESSGSWPMQDGVLDAVSIYNRALSASEIADIYAVGAAGKCLPHGLTLPGQQQFGSLLDARLTAGGFAFSFLSAASQNYTIEGNTSLNTTNWAPLTNLTGDGSVMRVNFPATNSSQGFFRLRQR
ncbi:MAG: LamG-like jellyroll fold domain-containing protein [Limisphaerales bacterium]